MSVKVFGKDIDDVLDSNGDLNEEYVHDNDPYDLGDYDPYEMGYDDRNYGGFRKMIRTKREFQ